MEIINCFNNLVDKFLNLSLSERFVDVLGQFHDDVISIKTVKSEKKNYYLRKKKNYLWRKRNYYLRKKREKNYLRKKRKKLFKKKRNYYLRKKIIYGKKII